MRNSSINDSSSGGRQRGGVSESWTYGGAQELFQDDRLKPAKMLRLLPATIQLPETAPGTSRTLRKSCDSCVRLKRACNGESPCRLCARMGKCCSRSAKKRSGPPKGTKYQPRRQQSPEALATHQPDTTTSGSSGSAGCSGSEADPSVGGGPHKVPKLRTGDDAAGAAAFIRRVGGVSKTGYQQQQQRSLGPPRSLNPASSSADLCAEKPEDDIRGEREAVATEVDDGALLLLRMLKTFHPSSRKLGFATNVETTNSLKATPPQAQRLPSLFDLGAVSSPAYPPSIMERQVVGCRPCRQTIPATRPRLQQHAAYAQPREEQLLPSLSASVTLSHAVGSRTRHLREAPAWGSFVETPSKKNVFDPYARGWVPPPMSSTFGSELRTHGVRGTGGLMTGMGMERRQDYQLCAKYRRVDAGGFAASPGMVRDEANPGMGARFSKCSGPARYPNSNFRRFIGGDDYYSG